MISRYFKPLWLALSLLIAGAVSGCGFTPLHGTGGASTPIANVNIDLIKRTSVIDNQAGFFVLQRFRDRMGTASDASPYILELTPRYNRRRLGLTNDDIASRYDITVTADWILRDAKTGKRLDAGRTQSTVSFGAPSGPFGVITADNVGVEQTAQETADKLILDLARYFKSEKAKTKT